MLANQPGANASTPVFSRINQSALFQFARNRPALLPAPNALSIVIIMNLQFVKS
jgi:hypothetical protein